MQIVAKRKATFGRFGKAVSGNRSNSSKNIGWHEKGAGGPSVSSVGQRLQFWKIVVFRSISSLANFGS